MGFVPSGISRLRIPYSDRVSLSKVRAQAAILIGHLKAPIRAKRKLQRSITVVQTKHPSISHYTFNFKRVGYQLPEEEPPCD